MVLKLRVGNHQVYCYTNNQSVCHIVQFLYPLHRMYHLFRQRIAKVPLGQRQELKINHLVTFIHSSVVLFLLY